MIQSGVRGNDSGDVVLLARRDDLFELRHGKIGRDFQQDRPNRLAIRFTDPAGDAIIADGKAVWVYLPSSAPGQVIKRPATDRGSVPIDFTGEFLASPRNKACLP